MPGVHRVETQDTGITAALVNGDIYRALTELLQNLNTSQTEGSADQG